MPADWQRLGLLVTDSAPVRANIVRVETRGGPEFDMHYALELGIVLSGRIRRIHRTWERILSVGQVWYCGMWERHGWEVVEAPCEHVVFVILPDLLFQPGLPASARLDWLAPFRVPPQERPQANGVRCQEVLGLARKLGATLTLPEEQRRLWARFLAFELMLLLLRDWKEPPVRERRSQDTWELLDGAVELVLRNRRPIRTEEAARAAGTSSSTFRRLFQEITGLPFAKFALRHRLAQAASQLLQTDDTLRAIAEAWGFTDDSHFHRAFLRHFGCSPGDFRRRRVGPGTTPPSRR